MTPPPGAAELLLTFVLPLAAAALAMVYAMVQWSYGLLAAPPDARRPLWGVTYFALWGVILALFARFILTAEGRLTAKDLGVLALVAGGWWGLHGLLIWFGRAIARANARDAAAAPPVDETPEEAEEEAAAEESPEPAAAPTPAPRRGRFGWVVTLLIVFGLLVIGEASPLMKALEVELARHEAAWLAGAIALAALGFVLLMGGVIHMVLTQGQAMSRGEIEAMARIQREVAMRPGTWGKAAYRIRGAAVGARAEHGASFAEIKAAWRAGAWWQSRRWRRLYAMGAGALCMLLGVFGIPFVLGPAGVKLLVLVVWLFVLVQLVRGFRRA